MSSQWWDWLKFFPFSKGQETRPKYTEIRGPYFTKPRANKWIFGDVAFYFDAPWANPVFSVDGYGSSVDGLQPGRVNLLTAHLEPVYNSISSEAPPSQWDKGFFLQ